VQDWRISEFADADYTECVRTHPAP
jgi:hypothetical protein